MMRMLLTIVAMTGGAGAAANAQEKAPACTITYRASDDIKQRIRQEGFDFDGFDGLCPALKRAGVVIDIEDGRGVMVERAYGWAVIRLVRTTTGAYSSRSQSNTVMSRTASTPEADLLVMAAMNNALAGVARDAALFIASVDTAERALRPGG